MRPLLDCCCGRHVARKHILRLRLRPATAQSRSETQRRAAAETLSVSHVMVRTRTGFQRCAAWVSPLSLGLSPWRSTTVSSATTSCGVRSPARLDVRQSHMLFLQPDCDTVVAPVADFRSAGSMWRSTASLAALPLRAASPSARPAGERPVLASHDVVSWTGARVSHVTFLV